MSELTPEERALLVEHRNLTRRRSVAVREIQAMNDRMDAIGIELALIRGRRKRSAA